MSDTPIATAPADKAQFWTETIAAFNASGQTVREFCRVRGLPEKRFYTWRRNLGLSPVRPTTPSASTPSAGFVPIRLLPDVTAEIVLANGVTLRIPVSAEPAHIARLVAALSGVTPC